MYVNIDVAMAIEFNHTAMFVKISIFLLKGFISIFTHYIVMLHLILHYFISESYFTC